MGSLKKMLFHRYLSIQNMLTYEDSNASHLSVKDNKSDVTARDGDIQVLQARDYQLEIFETVRKKNSIVVLGTGSGKTFISILLIKDLGHEIRGKLSDGSKRSFFVVNSVPLVYQQQRAIQDQTAFKVAAYEGSMGVDFWSEEKWRTELEENEVIVLVAQIFLNIILHKLIKFSDINILVLDECHHAQGNHPMREIMREYSNFKLNNERLPRICGMTASVVNCKVSHQKLPEKMRNLEVVLDSSLITTHYFTSVQKYMTNSKEIIVHHESQCESATSNRIINMINDMAVDAIKDIKCRLTLDEKHTAKAIKFVNKVGLGLVDMLNELGEYVCCEAVKLQVEALQIAESDNIYMKKVYERMYIHLDKLENSLEMISCFFDNILNHVTPKVLRLLEIISKGPLSNIHCIVFVKRRTTAKLIYYLLHKLSETEGKYAFLKVAPIVGGLSSIRNDQIRLKEIAKQEKVLKDFRHCLLNVIISTNVLEEGIDIRKCNLVIRFSIPDNFRSYIQSLGRARDIPSYFVILCHSELCQDLLQDINSYKIINNILTASCFDRELPTISEIRDVFDDCELPPFQPFGLLGPKITGLSAINLLNLYCGRLPKDRFTNLTVKAEHKSIENVFYTGLTLPLNASFRETVWSEGRTNFELAKKDAALRLCKKLYSLNKLNLNLLPKATSQDARDKDHLGISDQLANTKKEIGTRKNRQIHTRKLCSSFSVKGSLFLHLIDFAQVKKLRSDISFENDSNIGIICSEVIPSTIFHLENCKWGKLQITPKFIKQLDYDTDTNLILKFQQALLTQVMLIPKNVFKFDPNRAKHHVFIVPLDSKYNLDYHMMRNVSESSILNDIEKDVIIRSPNELLNRIVKPAYGKTSSDNYFVKEIRWDYSPESFYPDNKLSKRQAIKYVDYLKSFFGLEISNLTQPLINCSHMPKSFNSLSKCTYTKKAFNLLLLVPESCDIFTIPAPLYWKTMCMPSILHRINCFQLEKELLERQVSSTLNHTVMTMDYNWVNVTIDSLLINKDENICVNLVRKLEPSIPSGAIVNALTCKSAMDQFNLERLEVLGDSYLKFSSSRYLYVKEDAENEGVLTQCRSNIISNKTLFLLAEKKNLGDYIQGINLQHTAFAIPYGFIVRPEVEEVLLRDGVSPTEWNKFGQENVMEQCTNPYNPYRENLLSDKCISDTVESLIGSMLLCGGEEYAKHIMKWFGFQFLEEILPIERCGTSELKDIEIAEFDNLFSKNCLDRLENDIGYHFKNRRLLLQACSHPSYSFNEFTGCYQRLEFLGDAVLDYLITGYIYARYRDADPGTLTDWRSYFVNNETLARIAVQKRLHIYLLHLSPLLEKYINQFQFIVQQEEVELNSEKDDVQLEDIEIPKALGDLIESIIGAVYVDSGFNLDKTWRLVKRLFDNTFDKVVTVPVNCVRQLHERDSSVKFTSEQEDDQTVVTVHVKGLEPIKRLAKNKRIAKQAAAKYALYRLDQLERNSIN